MARARLRAVARWRGTGVKIADAPSGPIEIRVRGIVQGVGFRPFVYRLAREHGLTGWVLNDTLGVQIHVEGPDAAIDAFVDQLRRRAPPAADITAIHLSAAAASGLDDFAIRTSDPEAPPATRISPDLPVCEECFSELLDPHDARSGYPYITCTNCGPRYSIILGLPYDRPNTTMAAWALCETCVREYHDPGNRRFHAQPVACPRCGPSVRLVAGNTDGLRGAEAIERAAALLRTGAIIAIKGIGGYHLACDASNADAVERLRSRKFRKEKPFAVLARDLAVAERLIALSPECERLLVSTARPIVLARARIDLPGVAPGMDELGVMLPYTPLHHLLFQAGAPEALVMTSGNASSEPIAYEDQDARERLAGIADARLEGERPIGRRVDDSVARAGIFGPTILRRSRGYAPGAVAMLASPWPILAVGGDLKNTVTLVVQGEAFVSQHVGDLEHFAARDAFERTIGDFLVLWRVPHDELVVAHDLHPEYVSSQIASAMPAARVIPVQHHRAHVASVLAERGALEQPVIGVAFDGTGYGDDGTIWGGEMFVGSVVDGLVRVAHLRPARLAGGDAAARHPVQSAAGFLGELDDGRAVDKLSAAALGLPSLFDRARQLVDRQVRVFETTSAGRLFDAVAALLGFTRPVSYEGQAAVWLEHQARRRPGLAKLPFSFDNGVIDYRPALGALLAGRLNGADPADQARAFHRGLAHVLSMALVQLAETHGVYTVVLTGGVFQNELLLSDLKEMLAVTPLEIWTNRQVPPNDGGISLGQAALVAGAGGPVLSERGASQPPEGALS